MIRLVRGGWRRLVDDLGSDLVRDIVLVNLAVGVIGVSYGAITVGEGLPVWAPNLLSVVVLGGASQFLFTGIVGSGGSVVAAVLAGLLVNARHLPFGFALAGTVRTHPFLGSYLMIDEVVAFALAQRDEHRRRVAFFTCGVGLFLAWNLGSLAGALLGQVVSDTAAFGLDAAFPAVLAALVMPAMREPNTRWVALAGAVIAVVATPWVPPGVAVLLGLVALLGLRRPAETESGAGPSEAGPA